MDDIAPLIVHRRDSSGAPQFAETPIEAHQTNNTTRTAEFFVVNHYDPPPPEAPELGTIVLRSLGGEPTVVSLDDLKSLERRDVLALVECAGNGRRYVRNKAPGTQFGHGLCGVGAWEGIAMRDLLESRGLTDGWETLVVRGLDRGWASPENAFAQFGKGLPRNKALHPDTLLAWGMNGEPLSHAHGGPIRLVVPGWAGVWWVKWMHEVECSNDVFDGFWQTRRYRYMGGAFEEPEVVFELLPRALIVRPLNDEIVAPGELELAGKAWSGSGRIVRVEVSSDGGADWVEANLGAPESQWAWIDWRARVNVGERDGVGVATISARATDETGATQGWDSRWNALGYGNNDIMSVTVRVRR